MANTGAYPVDPTTSVGIIRTLIGDTEPTNIQGSPPDQTADYLWNSDAELEGLLTVYAQSPGGVAIHVLRLVSISQAMILKKWTSADLSVDGPAITRALTEAINAIEKGMAAGADLLASTYHNLVPTGAAVGRAYLEFHDRADEADDSLPWLV